MSARSPRRCGGGELPDAGVGRSRVAVDRPLTTAERGRAPRAADPEQLAAANGGPPPDAWDLKRAAAFLGLSPRTLERYVARRMVPVIVYPPARVEPGKKGSKPMLAFDPTELAAWRDRHKVVRVTPPGAGMRAEPIERDGQTRGRG